MRAPLLLYVTLALANAIRIEPNAANEVQLSVANPTLGVIDLEDEDTPVNNEKQMLEQQNMVTSEK